MTIRLDTCSTDTAAVLGYKYMYNFDVLDLFSIESSFIDWCQTKNKSSPQDLNGVGGVGGS